MPETPIRKPLVKKVEEPEVVKEESVFETSKSDEAEVLRPLEVSKPIEAPKPVGPKNYRCKTPCWAKKQLWEVGDVTSFEPGEFVPEHFQEMQ